ncbi:MAG: type II secretion system protein GspK [Pirellulales bacterium]
MSRYRAIRKPSARAARHGVVLVVVLVAVALLSLAAAIFAQLMFAEREAVFVHGRGVQSRSLVDSGVSWIDQQVILDPETLRQAGGLYNNPALFQGVIVLDDTVPRDRGRFTVLTPDVLEGGLAGFRYGLENESARLNLNALLLIDKLSTDSGRNLLMGLPGMTTDVADAILDWIDPDDTQRDFGAESDAYSGLVPAYAPKNGPLETVEELLLVRGVTPWLLFGADADRNGLIEPHEGASGASIAGVDNSDGSLDRGWSAYLTLYSQESDLDPDGQPRIDLNGSDLEQLHEDLSALFPEDWATFIVAYRQSGPFSGMDSVITQEVAGRGVDLARPGNTRLNTVLDLVGAKVQATFEGLQEPIVVESPFSDVPGEMDSYLPELLDHVTVNPKPTIPGRINVNQASRTVLLGIPGLEPDVVQRILSERDPEPGDDKPGRRHETWLLSEGLVTLDEMKKLMPFVTVGGSVYRAQVIGYFDASGPSTRAEIVLDATTAPPRLVFWRDLSHLGRGYTPETLGIQ